MTNDIETIILESNKSNYELAYKERMSYSFYKEIWLFILYILKTEKKSDFNTINIKFKVHKYDDSYAVTKSEGISFELIGDGTSSKCNTYYEGRDSYYMLGLLNTAFDLELLLDLLREDNFDILSNKDNNITNIEIKIYRATVEKVIDGVLLKNKILKLEAGNL